jgi:hypothetical protein
VTLPQPESQCPVPANVDQALADRASSSGEWIAGLIATAMLDTVAQPGKLPQLLFPDMAEADVWRVWELAIAVGYRAGRMAARPRFSRAERARLQLALAEAGYTAMAGLADRTAATVTPPTAEHPADPEHDQVRGDHW